MINTKKPTRLLSFEQAVNALRSADLVAIRNKHSEERTLVDTLTWAVEGPEESDFLVGNSAWGNIRLRHGKNVVRDGHAIIPPGYTEVVLELYKEKK